MRCAVCWRMRSAEDLPRAARTDRSELASLSAAE